VPGTKHGRIVIIGAGNVGLNAAKVAYGLGAQVTIIDTNHARLSYIDDIFDGKVITLMSTHRNISESMSNCDMLVGAVLIPGAESSAPAYSRHDEIDEEGQCVCGCSD